ncbi:MAG: WD40 repeat domain-containing protein, partial [Bacteroidota bacterium]
DNQYLLKLSNGTSFVKYQMESGQKLAEFGERFRDIVSTDFHNNGNYYLAATEDSVFVFNSSDKLHLKFLLEGEINDARFHPIEEQIVVALDKVAILVDLEGDEIYRFQGILNQSSTGLDYDLGNYWEHYIAKWVKYKPARFLNKQSLFVGKTGSKARKWDTKSAAISMEYIGHEKGILCFERIDDQTIATGGGDGKIIIWDEKKGSAKKVIKAHREPIFDIKLSNDGKMLASCAWDGVISFWNTDTWERYTYVYNEGNSAYEISFSDNDAYLIAAMLDKSLQLLEIETGRFVKEFVGHTDVVTSIEVADNQILTSGWDGQIIEWDLYSGLIRTRIKTEDPVFSTKWNNNQIISAGADRNLRFWSKQGTEQKQLVGHQAEINGIEIDGNLMITSDVDGVTKFWDLTKKQELFEHIQIGKNDWMIKTPEGYFDATDDAISNIHFVRGMDVYGASQLMEKFYVPGLAEDIFTKKGAGVSVGKALNQSPPPRLKLNGVLGKSGSAKLYLKAEDNGGGIENVTLFHNGKKVPFESQVQKVRSEDKARIYTIEFPLVAGLNEFSASAYSTSNLESNRPKVTLFSDSKLPGSTCHILAVGINEYKNQDLNLNYAKPDASSFASQMQAQGEAIYSNVMLHQIYDREAALHYCK